MRVAWHKYYAHPLPLGHKFPMEKYEQIPIRLLDEKIIHLNQFIEPKQIEEEIILQTHNFEFWNDLKDLNLEKRHARRMGFPQSKRLIERERIITQGTLDLSIYSLENKSVGLNVAGGTHHAFTNKAEGFCLLNDQAVSINYLLSKDLISKCLIIDLDVHQGNGTAEIFQNEDRVFTLSVHAKDNYPLEKERSDLDIELDHFTGDEEYIESIQDLIPELISKVKPDIVYFQAGVDILETDKFGKLKVSKEACYKRDELVISNCKKENLPLVITMGGGYSKNIKDIVDAHINTYILAKKYYV